MSSNKNLSRVAKLEAAQNASARIHIFTLCDDGRCEDQETGQWFENKNTATADFADNDLFIFVRRFSEPLVA